MMITIKVALITDITKQVGSYLSELLLKKRSVKSIIWERKDEKEIARSADNNEIAIRVEKRCFRPAEANQLLGDQTKAKEKLVWKATTSLEEIIEKMLEFNKKETLIDTIS